MGTGNMKSRNLRKITRRNNLEGAKFSEEDIAEAIKTIPLHSAPGPDGIPAKVLRECVEELKKPLYLLWRTSLDHGYVPSKLKQSKLKTIIHSSRDWIRNPQNFD